MIHIDIITLYKTYACSCGDAREPQQTKTPYFTFFEVLSGNMLHHKKARQKLQGLM